MGTIFGSAVSLYICGESGYGSNYWEHFTSSVLLSPILMTVGLLVSLGVSGPLFFVMLMAGFATCIASIFMGVVKSCPKPQLAMFAGSFTWSLGNATALEAMMGV